MQWLTKDFAELNQHDVNLDSDKLHGNYRHPRLELCFAQATAEAAITT